MIHTDGATTVANHPGAMRRENRKRAAIHRAWNSVCRAYPDALTTWRVAETARQVGASRAAVERSVLHVNVIDWQDYDANRWNLH